MPNTTKNNRSRAALTPKRRRFALEFLVDLSAKEAAIRAGYPARSAKQIGHELLLVPEVRRLIETAQARLRDKTELSVERVVEELRRIAFGDLRALFDEHGHLRPLRDLPEEVAAMLASVKVVTRPVAGGQKGDVEYVHEIKAWDKPRALETLARHLGMLLDRTKLEGTVALEPLTKEQAARLSTEDLEQIVKIAKKAQGESQ